MLPVLAFASDRRVAICYPTSRVSSRGSTCWARRYERKRVSKKADVSLEAHAHTQALSTHTLLHPLPSPISVLKFAHNPNGPGSPLLFAALTDGHLFAWQASRNKFGHETAVSRAREEEQLLPRCARGIDWTCVLQAKSDAPIKALAVIRPDCTANVAGKDAAQEGREDVVVVTGHADSCLRVWKAEVDDDADETPSTPLHARRIALQQTQQWQLQAESSSYKASPLPLDAALARPDRDTLILAVASTSSKISLYGSSSGGVSKLDRRVESCHTSSNAL